MKSRNPRGGWLRPLPSSAAPGRLVCRRRTEPGTTTRGPGQRPPLPLALLQGSQGLRGPRPAPRSGATPSRSCRTAGDTGRVHPGFRGRRPATRTLAQTSFKLSLMSGSTKTFLWLQLFIKMHQLKRWQVKPVVPVVCHTDGRSRIQGAPVTDKPLGTPTTGKGRRGPRRPRAKKAHLRVPNVHRRPEHTCGPEEHHRGCLGENVSRSLSTS